MSPETEGRIPENLIPADKKGNALWKWLKELLQKAATKFADAASPKDDPDKKAGNTVVKNLKNIAEKIKAEQAEAAARGETPDNEIDSKMPPALREVVDKLNVGNFIDKYDKEIIETLSYVASGVFGVEEGIIELGLVVARASGADKAIARKIAPLIREKVAEAKRKLHILHGKDHEGVQKAEAVSQELERLSQEEPDPRTQERPQRGERSDDGVDRYSEQDKASLKTRLKAGMTPEDLAWFDAIETPEAFVILYEERIEVERARAEADKIPFDLAKAREKVSQDATEFVMNALMTVYSPILDEEPNEFFDKQAMNAGNQYSNPFTAAKTFSKMLNALREKSKISGMARTPEGDAVRDKKYLRLAKKKQVVKNDKTGQLEEVMLATTEYEAVSVGDFAEYLREAFDSGEGTVEFGHNFKLLTAMGPREERGEPGSFFKSIAEYAGKKFTSDAIDTAFRLPHNDIVQAAKQKFQSSYARMLLDNGWQKDPQIAEKFLQSMPATERRVKEELREQFQGQDVPDWAIEWAFQMGRTMYFGLDFGFHEIMSYADPDLKYDGNTTFIGMGHMRGYFDMWESAKLLNTQRKDLHLAKAVWLPYTLPLGDRKYDSEEWSTEGQKRWRESFTMGKMSFAGSFLDGHKLFIDMGNITGAGGWGTNQGWRVREGYNTWLMDEFTGNTSNRLEIGTGDDDKFVNAWKRLENIGITVSENFMQQYVFPPALNDKATEPYMKAVRKLSDFFYDRYFTDEHGNVSEIGKELLKDIVHDHSSSHAIDYKAELWHYLEHAIKEHKGERKDKLFKIMRKISTVQTFEQMPALFMTMEKQRATEYGVTMLSEMQDHFLTKESGDTKKAKERSDHALGDLIYAQEQMRIDVSKDMEANLKSPHKNLYGDLSQKFSSVRDNKGNKIDEEYIGRILRARFSDASEEERNKRVADAQHAYKFIKQRLTERVTMDDIRKNAELKRMEKKDAKRFKAIEDKVTNGQVRTRVNWWANALDENIFGHAVTQPSVAMKFINTSATGPDTVKRDAIQAADTAELMHTVSQGLYSAMKKAAFTSHDKGDHAGFEELSEWIRSYKGKVQGELGSEVSYTTVFRTAQLIDLFFKKDDEANKWWKLGPQRYWSEVKKRSISDSLIDEGAPVWAWDHDLEHAWAEHLHHKGQLKRKPSTGEKHKIVPRKDLAYRILKKIPFIKNKIKDTKTVHDYVNTISYHSLFEWSNSGYGQLLKYHWFPTLLALMATIGVIAAKKGAEELDSGGGGGGGGGGGHGGHH